MNLFKIKSPFYLMQNKRLIIQEEFTKFMELDASWNDEERYIWAFIHYQKFHHKFRYVKKFSRFSDENLLYAKILINFYAARYGIRYEDSLEVLADFAEKLIYKL